MDLIGGLRRIRAARRLRPQTVEPIDQAVPPLTSQLVRDWIRVAFGADPQAEHRALEALRADPASAIRDLSMAYKLAPETEYAFRFALVYAAGEIRSPVALGFLEEVLAKEIPPERWPGAHQRSTVAQETSIRCQAVEAIAGIAAMPDAEGLSSIVRIVRDLDYAVRVMAAQAIRGLPGRPITDEQIREALPKGEAESILAMRRVPVTELTVEEVPVRTRGLTPPPDTDATDRTQIAGRRPPPRIGE